MLRRPRLPMTAHGVGPSTRPTENWQHHFSYWTSTGTGPKAPQSAYRNTVEKQHASQPNNKSKNPKKENGDKPLTEATFS